MCHKLSFNELLFKVFGLKEQIRVDKPLFSYSSCKYSGERNLMNETLVYLMFSQSVEG